MRVPRFFLLSMLTILALGIVSAVVSVAQLQNQFVGTSVVPTPGLPSIAKSAPPTCADLDETADESDEDVCAPVPSNEAVLPSD